jgi:predicted DNA-binding antitoxin AbrB/MazE fold protein
MSVSFNAIYKNGVFEPLTKIPLKEQQKVLLKIISPRSRVNETRGMIKGNEVYLKQIAESKELLEWNLY